MVQAAVLGSSRFIVGFQLAGIRETIEASKEPLKDIAELRMKKDIGIVIIEESILEKMDIDDRREIEDSVDPVFIPISAKAEQESLKRLIKRSIGIDLWG